jgi:putative peptidoglycan lipid II flippase
VPIPISTRLRSVSSALTFNLIGKGLGFLIPLVIAANFGVSQESDSFFLAFAIVSILLPIWTQSVEQFSVPLYADVMGPAVVRDRAHWIRCRAVAGAAAATVIAGIALYLYLLTWSSASFCRSTMISYLLLAPQVVIGTQASVYSAYLIARGEYRWPPGTIGLRAVGVLLLVALFHRSLGLASVAAGYSVGELARLIALRWTALRRLKAECTASHGRGEPLPGTTVRGAHQLGSMALMGIGPLVERSFAATLGTGAVSRLEYATKLFYIPAVVFDTSFVAVFLSDWSRAINRAEWKSFLKDVKITVHALLAGATILGAIAFVLREQIVRLALARGAFVIAEARSVAAIFGVLVVAMPFYTAVMLIAAAYVALGENRLIFRISVLKIAVWVVSSLLLGRTFGLYGIAWAFVIAHVLQFALLYGPFAGVVDRRIQGSATLVQAAQ